MQNTHKSTEAAVELRAADLQGHGVVACPPAQAALWRQHPRVFIDVAGSGQGRCPYCGTVYRLKDGEKAHHAH